MRPFFARVECIRYEDALRITEPGAVIDYLSSLPWGASASEEERAAIRARVTEAIERAGAFHVTKDTGMLRARAA